MMFMYLRSLVMVALLAGSVAGLVSWAAHMLSATPIILEAETHEQAGEAQAPASDPALSHEHEAEAFAPEDGWERNLYTLAADIVTGIGFAMLMVAGFALFGRGVDARKGLLWGAAGFAAFTLAPSFGLPPELPGTEAAPLLARQIWWLLTAAATLLGIALCVKVRRPYGWLLGLLLIATPHLVGAPLPEIHVASAPEELQHLFVVVAIGTGLLFWLVLGAIAGLFYIRLAGEIQAS